MKKLLPVFLVCLLAITSKASHLMGGQMTSRNIGGLTYEVTITAYRDTLGVPMYTRTYFNYSDGVAWSQIDTVALSAPSVFGNGVEEYTYTDTVTFPASGSYSMSYEDCCRNAAILNMANPGSEYFHLYNNLWADSTNSSPVFLNPPIPIAQVGITLFYNPLPFDADGDSIAWMLDTPVTHGGIYVSGYSLPPSDITVPFTMDTVTGVISFLPTTTGHFEVSVLVNEFRNGLQIGQIRRDMQIIVVNSGNRPLLVSSSANGTATSNRNFNLNPNTPFTISVTVLDPDYNTLSMTARGEPFLLANNPVNSSIINSAGVSTGTISWTPDQSQIRNEPYLFSLRINEPYDLLTFGNDLTYSLRVSANAVGLNPISNESIHNIYPNPNTGIFTVEINIVSAGKSDLIITNLIGQQVHVVKNIQLNEGVNAVVVKDASLPKGNYMLSIVKNGKTTAVRNFEVTY